MTGSTGKEKKMGIARRIRRLLACAAGLAVAGSCLHATAARAADTAAPSQAADALTWDLSDLYASPQAWSDAYAKAREAAGKLDGFKGTLGQSADAMLRALAAISDARRESTRLFVYARLKGDEDLRVGAAQERAQQAQSLQTLIEEKAAWLAPEVLGVGADRTRAFIAASAELRRRFDFMLEDILRNAPHTLGPEAEAVLAAGGDVLAQPENIYEQITDADLPYPTIEFSTGEKVRMDKAAFSKWRAAPSREDRKKLFDQYYAAWQGFQGSIGATMTSQVMGDVFAARTRRFQTSLEAALFSANMPAEVYRTLVAQTNAALPTLHRYLRLRKRLMGVAGDLAYYDNYPPLFPAPAGLKYDVAESERVTLAALQPMGEEYLALLRRGFSQRWMSALPQRGKRSGAYMMGAAYDVHPYLLLNHNDDYYSLSTLAHEWGHAVHTMLADRSQPFEKAGYSTFIAESASIGNEMLLNDYMVARAKTREEKLFYLGQGLESIRTTFFRQVMFAEFQLAMHEEVESGRTLSGERLTDMYCTLLRRYYGEAEGAMKIDPVYCTEWENVPHFYYGYYVYQYATSMAGAAQFTGEIAKGGKEARDRFLAMLKAGGSDYAYELYKRAGVDMASPKPYQALVARMNRIMDDIEALAGKP
jgi:oligoendopeptidase F